MFYVDERVRAIDNALGAMDPPLEVFGGVLKLIAEFAAPYGEFQGPHDCDYVGHR